jgi:hypothetical protein
MYIIIILLWFSLVDFRSYEIRNFLLWRSPCWFVQKTGFGSEGSPDSLVCVLAIGLQAGRSENQGSIPGWCKRFFSLVLTSCDAHPTTCQMSTDNCFPWIKAVGAWSWPSVSCAEVKNVGAMLPLFRRLHSDVLSYNTGLHRYVWIHENLNRKLPPPPYSWIRSSLHHSSTLGKWGRCFHPIAME